MADLDTQMTANAGSGAAANKASGAAPLNAGSAATPNAGIGATPNAGFGATANTTSAATAGAKLRAAREAAGLSIDDVAQQLKLAPRQVTALEEDDWQRLPGRTFVRGFARNYARFLHLDPDALLALLPAADAAPALQRPTLAASPRPMGEIPAERVAKPSSARWLLPLLLLVIVGVVGYYEMTRPSFHVPALLASLVGEHRSENESAAAETTRPPMPSATPSAATPASSANPVADAAPAAGTSPAQASTGAATAKPAPANAITVLPTPSADAAPSTDAPSAPAPAQTSSTAAPGASAPAATTPATEVPLVLTFKGTSWAEVKDAKGRVVLQMTGGAGMTQTVSALPPLELALGNAPDVAVTFRGQALDLSAYTRGKVARVSLQ